MVIEIFQGDLLPYAAAFLVLFAVLFFALQRTPFGENRTVSTIISVCVALLSLYGLINYTELFDSFSILFVGFDESLRFFILIAVVFLIMLLLYRGFKKYFQRAQIPVHLVAITILLVFAFFIDNVVSIYYLPEWLVEFGRIEIFGFVKGFLQWVSLVLAVIFGVYSLRKTRFGKEAERNVGGSKINYN